jgi:hypothetical protein
MPVRTLQYSPSSANRFCASSSLFSYQICRLYLQIFSALTPAIFGAILLRGEGQDAQLIDILAREKKGFSYMYI